MNPRATAYRLWVGKDAHKFSSAHMTVFPDGTKERLHGHNFAVQLAVDLHDISFRNFFDFSVLKKALSAQCQDWDDRFLLADRCPFYEVIAESAEEIEFRLCGKRYVMPRDEVVFIPVENISTETLAEEFTKGILARLDMTKYRDLIQSIEVSIMETQGQCGMYRWSWETNDQTRVKA